jgi:hypothetical protein
MDKKPNALRTNGNFKPLIINKIENSNYLVFSIDNLGVSKIEIDF